MITTRFEFGQTITETTDSDRATTSRFDGARVWVCFGRMERGDFIVAHRKQSRPYKTVTGADKAIAAWVNN